MVVFIWVTIFHAKARSSEESLPLLPLTPCSAACAPRRQACGVPLPAGICFLPEAPERANGSDRRRGNGARSAFILNAECRGHSVRRFRRDGRPHVARTQPAECRRSCALSAARRFSSAVRAVQKAPFRTSRTSWMASSFSPINRTPSPRLPVRLFSALIPRVLLPRLVIARPECLLFGTEPGEEGGRVSKSSTVKLTT